MRQKKVSLFLGTNIIVPLFQLSKRQKTHLKRSVKCSFLQCLYHYKHGKVVGLKILFEVCLTNNDADNSKQ